MEHHKFRQIPTPRKILSYCDAIHRAHPGLLFRVTKSIQFRSKKVCKACTIDEGAPHDFDMQLTFPIKVPSAVLRTKPNINVFEEVSCVPFSAFDITSAVFCHFLTQELHFRMCNMKNAIQLNFKAFLTHTAQFLKRKSQTGSWLARCCLLEHVLMQGTISLKQSRQNCRGLWRVVPNSSGISKQNRIHRSNPQIHQNGMCANHRHHKTENIFNGSAGFPECESKHTQ